jgi:hypothetical protein
VSQTAPPDPSGRFSHHKRPGRHGNRRIPGGLPDLRVTGLISGSAEFTEARRFLSGAA